MFQCAALFERTLDNSVHDVELDGTVGQDLGGFCGITEKAPQAALGHVLHQDAETLVRLVNCESEVLRVRQGLLKRMQHASKQVLPRLHTGDAKHADDVGVVDPSEGLHLC